MEKNNPLALVIDFGTQSVRAVIFDQAGKTLAMEKSPYGQPYFSSAPGYAEQDPTFYWEHMKKATLALSENQPELLKRVVTFSITAFRDTPVFLDEKCEVVRPSILWLDQRQAELKKKLSWPRRFLFWLVGMKETIRLNMKRTPAIWLQENEPENWARIHHYVALSTYLTYKLSGRLVDSPANYTGHFPIHFKKRKFYQDNALKGQIFRIPHRLLPELVPIGSLIGKISPEVSKDTGIPAGLEFYATGTDKGAETIGTGCTMKDMASISYGTASTIEVNNPKYIEPEPFLPDYPAPIPGFYQMEVQIYRGYWMIGWYMKEFAGAETAEAEIEHLAVEEVLNRKMLAIPPGSEGLILQPYWGPGLRRPEARGAIIGFSDVHTRVHMYRAIVEGIAFALRDGLEGIEKRQHHKVKEIRVSGGGSQSDAICQITADIFGIPVSRIQTYETASLGTAMAAFIAHGDFNSYEEAIKSMVHPTDRFEPNMKNHEQYEYLYNKVYRKVYPRLGDLYKRLREYSNVYPVARS